jgi:Ca2+-binding RTX toxin-like protein
MSINKSLGLIMAAILGTTGSDALMGVLGESNSIDGLEGNDTIRGGNLNDTINGNDGDDAAYGGSGNDLMYGNNGIDNFEGNDGNDTIFGNNDDDGLAGQGGNDFLVGGNGRDRLYGWLGNDVLEGGTGDDSLYGGSGDDLLTGGDGADTFNFGNDFLTEEPFASLGLDNITDFQSGLDKIQLQGSAFPSLKTISFATVTNDNLAAARSEIIVYNQANGILFYNANGVDAGLGEGVAFAKFTSNPTLTVADFTIGG